MENFINNKYTLMCIKMINKQDIIEINRNFHSGIIVNGSSLDFALSHTKDSKDWIKQLAYLVRAILIDHVFEDGNKRTASNLMMTILEYQKLSYDPNKIDQIIIKILKNRINSVEEIRRMIKNAIR